MVSNQKDLHQVGIDDFFHALRSLGIKTNDISGDTLTTKFSIVIPNVAHQRHSSYANYEPENMEEEGDNVGELVQQSHKQRVQKPKKILSLQVRKGYILKPT